MLDVDENTTQERDHRDQAIPDQRHQDDRRARVGSAGFLDDFVQWYNHQHAHTGIGLNTPADVHYGLATAKATDRAATLAAARAATPERFTSTTPPKILQLPDAAWINPPLLPAEPAA